MRRYLAVLAVLAGSARANPSGPGEPPDPVEAVRHRIEGLPYGDHAVAPIRFEL